MLSKQSTFFAYAIMLIVIAGVLEGLAYLFAKNHLGQSPLSFIAYDREYEFRQEDIAEYFARMDTVLGWPPPDTYGTERYDNTGARPTPAFPVAGNACVSLYGDSYTYSTSVDTDAAAWGNVLSEQLGCRVANYGVSGYGTDQAVLRFQENLDDEAATVILGLATVDILRIVNQDRRFIWGPDSGLAFKPRFVWAADGDLQPLDIPPITPEQIPEYVRTPENFLEHEWFLPDTEGGPVTIRFPYSLSILRGLMSRRVLDKLLGRPSWISFYSPDHNSGALNLLVGIMGSFSHIAVHRNMEPLILIIPTSQDLWYMSDNGVNPVQPLLDKLRQANIRYFDLTPQILQHVGQRDICEIFEKKVFGKYCWGHYNNEGDAIIASLVYDYLRAKNRSMSLNNHAPLSVAYH